MKLIDKKRLLAISIAAFIITLVVNFPHLFNLISSEQIPLGAPPRGMLMKVGPPPVDFTVFQVIWYFVLSFCLLLSTSQENQKKNTEDNSREFLFSFLKILILVSLFFVIETLILRQFIDSNSFRMRRNFDAILFSRYLFVIIFSFLTGLLFKILDKQNRVQVENERLRSENLQIRYNALTNQMNPHFFFNSLNSLQYLLMEREQEKSIIYINELSSVFRYILQSSRKELVTLQEELDFLQAYRFLLEIRFEEKIQFVIDVPETVKHYRIPVLTLQPLVENAINHNTCTLQRPLVITICMKNDRLIVSNTINPKIRKEKGEGIGLENLRNRFLLLLNQEIVVEENPDFFKISLPVELVK